MHAGPRGDARRPTPQCIPVNAATPADPRGNARRPTQQRPPVNAGDACRAAPDLPCYTPPMPPDRRELPDEPPPFLRTWPRVYTAVAVYLALLIALCYAFTRHFS